MSIDLYALLLKDREIIMHIRAAYLNAVISNICRRRIKRRSQGIRQREGNMLSKLGYNPNPETTSGMQVVVAWLKNKISIMINTPTRIKFQEYYIGKLCRFKGIQY
ncbi:hypothetical protein ABW19_dt0202022 [Dactylella cylindrospora]|nr:hypothetical protein ABW19_dt0202022 [Dactylella cylindrospora]